jgi:TRAP-type uncharacterized transport system fused permease subunit
MFVYEPALLMIGEWPWIIWRVVVSCIGISLLAGGLHGYYLRWMPNWQRAVAIVAAFSLVVPNIYADLFGIGLAVALITLQYFTEPETRKSSIGTAAVENSRES